MVKRSSALVDWLNLLDDRQLRFLMWYARQGTQASTHEKWPFTLGRVAYRTSLNDSKTGQSRRVLPSCCQGSLAISPPISDICVKSEMHSNAADQCSQINIAFSTTPHLPSCICCCFSSKHLCSADLMVPISGIYAY